ncbi:MAG TPA: thioredoxin domain-containing protein, partial [Pirellulales bacterium]|nr:thioredoxin domain-containing protein [Pirellulales bacterium]
MPNHLATETSPYLLQHKDNPVDWYPWGPKALERAKAEQKPIFLSIGYSACHWCHVMEHESFENPRIARLLNEHFVSIKVDREERPDLDQIYMNAVQMLTGRGGWPMSVFLTPDLQPFYGGTYWPDSPRGGMPGFDQVLDAVAAAWRDRREEMTAQADELTKHLRGSAIPAAGDGELSERLLRQAETALERSFDPRHGGFGGAPKFPHPMDLRLLLRVWKRNQRDSMLQVITTTLDKMAAGGIYDHLGGGFHRYSVDDRWLVPHFEKMLYDNALLAAAYVEGYLATGRADYARVARETLDYILRDMTDPAGGIYSTEDADSEGEEGKFYVWTPSEIAAVLGPSAAEIFCYVYDVTDEGNFEHKSILNLPKTIEQCARIKQLDADKLRTDLAEWRAKLLAARGNRIRPGRDDKVLVSWNGLAIDALAQAAGALDEPRYLAAAKSAADFILTRMSRPDGRLLHTWRGEAKLDAYLDDYAALCNGLVSLYEAGFDEHYIDEAVRLAKIMLA